MMDGGFSGSRGSKGATWHGSVPSLHQASISLSEGRGDVPGGIRAR